MDLVTKRTCPWGGKRLEMGWHLISLHDGVSEQKRFLLGRRDWRAVSEQGRSSLGSLLITPGILSPLLCDELKVRKAFPCAL